MKKLLKIFIIFAYFALCFALKGDFEAQLNQNSYQSYSSAKSGIEQINYQDNSALVQADNQEITNLQNNTRTNSYLDKFKKQNILQSDYVFKEIVKHFSNRKFLAFNFKHIICTRAP